MAYATDDVAEGTKGGRGHRVRENHGGFIGRLAQSRSIIRLSKKGRAERFLKPSYEWRIWDLTKRWSREATKTKTDTQEALQEATVRP